MADKDGFKYQTRGPARETKENPEPERIATLRQTSPYDTSWALNPAPNYDQAYWDAMAKMDAEMMDGSDDH